jgi:hypothetical protein
MVEIPFWSWGLDWTAVIGSTKPGSFWMLNKVNGRSRILAQG